MSDRPQGRPKKDGIKATVVVTRDATSLWEGAASRLGVSKTAALEMALREFAERRGLRLNADGKVVQEA